MTTHSHILSSDEVDELSECLQQTCTVHSFLLQEFDTELDFTSKIRYIYPLQWSARERSGGWLDTILVSTAMQAGTKIGIAGVYTFVYHDLAE